MIAGVLGYVGVFLLNVPHLTWVIVGVTILFGLGTGGVYYIPWTTYTFMADVDEVVTNRRREGVYAGAMTMAGKLMRASIVFLLGVVLQWFGFESGASSQPDSAVHAIIGVLIIGVCGLAVLGIVFSFKMKLDHKTHKVVIDELKHIHEGGRKEDVLPEVKETLEKLTGIPYERCFGNNNIGYKPKQ